MQHNATLMGHGALPSASRAQGQVPVPSENECIKSLLRDFGLRTSLVRLKVIDALYGASRHDLTLGVRGVHAHLQADGVTLSFPSVREVLKRLEADAVIVLQQDKSYALAPLALARLEQGKHASGAPLRP